MKNPLIFVLKIVWKFSFYFLLLWNHTGTTKMINFYNTFLLLLIERFLVPNLNLQKCKIGLFEIYQTYSSRSGVVGSESNVNFQSRDDFFSKFNAESENCENEFWKSNLTTLWRYFWVSSYFDVCWTLFFTIFTKL